MSRGNRAVNPNKGKPRWSVIDFDSIEGMVRVLEWGAKHRGGVNNWKKGYNADELKESMFRHLKAMFNGEENDPETGLPHIYHLMCKSMFYAYHHRNKSFLKERSNPF